MTSPRSNSYKQLEQLVDDFEPERQVNTYMVFKGPLGSTPTQAQVAVQHELAQLMHVAEAFNVFITVIYDDVENMALVALNGSASGVGDLAAFMAGTNAR